MTRVAIIGGGIGGLTAACALSRRGIEVTVHEAAPELREIGAGVALGPNAMKVLRALELEDPVRAVAGRSRWQVTRNGRTGRVISRASHAEQLSSFGAASATVHRSDLLEVLAAALPSGIAQLGARCISVVRDGDLAVARFENGGAVEADAIVGADGIHSRVRESLFGSDAPRFTGKICYRSVVPVAAVPGEAPPNDSAQWLGPHGTIVVYPLRRDELINVVCHYDDEGYEHESWVTECDRDEVLARYGNWHESLLRIFAAGERWYKWALYDREPIPRWTQWPHHPARGRRTPDAAVSRPGRLPGDRGRVRARGGTRRPARGPGWCARAVRARAPTAREQGRADRPRARPQQPSRFAADDIAPRRIDRGAPAPASRRSGRPWGRLDRSLRRQLSRRPLGLTRDHPATAATGLPSSR